MPLREKSPGATYRPGPLPAGNGIRINPDSIAWLAAAAIVFTLAVLIFTPLRMSLSWDETVYASQISRHAPMLWGSERARGLPLLLAPVTLLTDSVLVLRLYLAVLAGAGLFLALLAWRRLSPAWVLALAGVIYGGLGVAQEEASLLFPNYWIAIGSLAAVGLSLQVMQRGRASPGILVSLGSAVAFTGLMRPQDAAFVFAPLLAVALVALVRRSVARRPAAFLAAMAAGLAIAFGEWLVESYLYFTGPLTRLHQSAAAVGGTQFNPLNNLRVLGGGRVSSVAGYPGIHGWSRPGLLLWWLLLLILAILGVRATRHARGWLLAVAPMLCALSIYVLYSVPVRDNARYLLPAWALLAMPAADGIAWLATTARGRTRLAAVVTAALFVVVELGTQHAVLDGQVGALQAAARYQDNAVSALRRAGVRAPCTIATMRRPHFAALSEPTAYYLGCKYARASRHLVGGSGGRVVVLMQGPGRPVLYARDWPVYPLNGTGDVVAYVQPAQS